MGGATQRSGPSGAEVTIAERVAAAAHHTPRLLPVPGRAEALKVAADPIVRERQVVDSLPCAAVSPTVDVRRRMPSRSDGSDMNVPQMPV